MTLRCRAFTTFPDFRLHLPMRNPREPIKSSKSSGTARDHLRTLTSGRSYVDRHVSTWVSTDQIPKMRWPAASSQGWQVEMYILCTCTHVHRIRYGDRQNAENCDAGWTGKHLPLPNHASSTEDGDRARRKTSASWGGTIWQAALDATVCHLLLEGQVESDGWKARCVDLILGHRFRTTLMCCVFQMRRVKSGRGKEESCDDEQFENASGSARAKSHAAHTDGTVQYIQCKLMSRGCMTTRWTCDFDADVWMTSMLMWAAGAGSASEGAEGGEGEDRLLVLDPIVVRIQLKRTEGPSRADAGPKQTRDATRSG